jgi:hypothetical protein
VVAGIAVMLTIPVTLYEARFAARSHARARACPLGVSFCFCASVICPASADESTTSLHFLPPRQVGNHLQHFYEPRLQLLVVRILWMVRARESIHSAFSRK